MTPVVLFERFLSRIAILWEPPVQIPMVGTFEAGHALNGFGGYFAHMPLVECGSYSRSAGFRDKRLPDS